MKSAKPLVMIALAVGLLFGLATHEDKAHAQGLPLGITALSLNQLPDCSRFGLGNYTFVQKVTSLPKTLLNLPLYDCVRLDATVQLTGQRPTLLTVPPPAVVSIGFIWGEVPGGIIDGTNTVFTLLNAPPTPQSVQIFRNLGVAVAGTDFTVNGKTITFAVAPLVGDTLVANYATK